MKSQKRIFAMVLFVVVLLCCSTVAANNVSEIDISVTVRDDGSAYVVQNWTGNFYEGTENYIPIATGDTDISDFRVADEEGAYTYIDNWSVDADFDQKARKCGINKTADGVELCFGISRYGKNRYAIEYVITDFIKSYTDYDGTNYMFINPGMSTFPTDVHVNIVMHNGTKLNANNSGIWSFGYDGSIEFADGGVSAYTTSALTGENCVIVMMRLNKGIIYPEAFVNQSFDSVRDAAFSGSDYINKASVWEYVAAVAVAAVILLLMILIAVHTIRRRREIKKFFAETDYYRDVPNGGDMELSYFLVQNFDVAHDRSLIIPALMLSMVNKGCIEPVTTEDVGVFGRIADTVCMRLVKEPDTAPELRLYAVLAASAGADGTLQEKELEKYAYINPDSVNSIIDGAKVNGEMTLIRNGGFVSGSGNCIKHLSPIGKQQLGQIAGLKKYLEEFSLISERGVDETAIWKEYMVYAAMFGIADKVMEQLKKLYPDKLPEFDMYNRNIMLSHSYYRSMHRSAQRAVQRQRASGGGGRASMRGGGGFSGGGRGGGSR